MNRFRLAVFDRHYRVVHMILFSKDVYVNKTNKDSQIALI
jgi:hypothetical protein